VILAGGQENMSLAPMALPKARWGHRMELTGVGDVLDLMVFDGLWEIFYGYHMGLTAEAIASLYGISRREQDELGVLSHTRARSAIIEGLFAKEIAPVIIKTRKGETVIDADERPMDTNMEKMGKLRPAFKKDGTVTAGNASGINDAAAAVLLMSADKAKTLSLEPIVKIKAFASGGVDPAYMGLGPIPAIRKALTAAGMTLGDINMIELNEAFAAQAIGCMRELGIENDRPNELGSGISLGHPIGCTGARQMVTGMNHMQRNGYSTGLISMCIGGGMGMAMIVER
jgi:acetyl-CoA C-acetyltransferase